MGQLALDIHDEAAAHISVAPVTDPADLLTGPQLLAIFAKVEAAVAALELLMRGARIVRVAGVPDNVADGEDGDLGLDTLTTFLYAKDAGVWTQLFRLKGDKGDNVKGDAGLNAYQLALQQGFVGSLNQWLASLGRKGDAGLSAYQVAVANGFAGTIGQWLDSLKVKGDPGARGNTIVDKSYAPTTEPSEEGDTWYHSISAQKFARYVYYNGAWSLRFTSPDPVTSSGGGGTGTVKSVSVNGGAPVSPDNTGNVALTVAGGGSATTVDADLVTNPASTTNAASVKAVNDVVGFLVNLKTSVKTSLVAGINALSDLVTSLRSDVGTLANLSTTAKGSLVGAINELASLIPQTPVTRNVYDVDSQKKSDVVSANQARVLETQSTYYDREFYDSTSFTPLVYGFKCVPIAEAGATNWYWIRREIK